jgi:hypothetical protein
MGVRKVTGTPIRKATGLDPADGGRVAGTTQADNKLKATGDATPTGDVQELDGASLLEQALKATEVAKAEKVALVDVTTLPEARADVRLAQDTSNKPSEALTGPSRILDPRLMAGEFEALLDKPFVPTREVDPLDTTPSVTQAQLPADRTLPHGHGSVSFAHDGEKLTITGTPADGGKPEVLTRNAPLGKAAQFATAFDAALAKKYPTWDPDERAPKELWIAFADTQKAAARAVRLDEGKRSLFDAAQLLRSYCPKAEPLLASKTTMAQIQALAGIASAVNDGPGTPEQNLVGLELKAMQASGRSMLDELIVEHDRKHGNLSELDAILAQPVAKAKAPELPSDDKAVVGQLDGREVTAGEIREMAFRKAGALEFLIPGFADNHGSEHTLKIHLEKKGKDIEWSFYGVKGDRMGIQSGTLSPKGVNDFLEVIAKQPRYDMIPYEPKGKPVTATTTQDALDGLERERQRIDEELQARGGVKITDIFPDFDA